LERLPLQHHSPLALQPSVLRIRAWNHRYRIKQGNHSQHPSPHKFEEEDEDRSAYNGGKMSFGLHTLVNGYDISGIGREPLVWKKRFGSMERNSEVKDAYCGSS
jgi:hypothetical protein